MDKVGLRCMMVQSFLRCPSVNSEQLRHLSRLTLHGEREVNPLRRQFDWVEHYNKVKLPPQKPDEPRRAAQAFHMRAQIRGNLDRAWYSANLIRGLTIDEAIKQLSQSKRKS